MAEYEAVVIGAGVEGSATAYQLAKHGKKTLLLEQFPLPHTRGSSHGQSRIIRKAYVQPYYAEMMLEAFPMWEQLQHETNTVFYKNTGMLLVGKKGSDAVSKTTEALFRVNCKHRTMSSEDLKKKYPMLNFDDSYSGVLDEEAGILHADKCLAKLQEMFVRFGGTIRDAEKVTDIQPGNVVSVTTTKGQYRADSIVIAAGPWASQLLEPLGLKLPLQIVGVKEMYWKLKCNSSDYCAGKFPILVAADTVKDVNGNTSRGCAFPINEYPSHLKPVRVTVCYWRAKCNPAEYSVGKFPTFIMPQHDPNYKDAPKDIYGLPANEYQNHVKPVRVTVCYWRYSPAEQNVGKFPTFIVPGGGQNYNGAPTDIYGLPANEYQNHAKVCFHGGPPIDPDARDIQPDISWDVDSMRTFVKTHLPGLEDVPSISERCIYTMTPDEDFVLDTHPIWKNIVIGAGFSGHGFKLAPVVGKILGQLATGQKPKYDMSPFSIDRFSKKSKL